MKSTLATATSVRLADAAPAWNSLSGLVLEFQPDREMRYFGSAPADPDAVFDAGMISSVGIFALHSSQSVAMCSTVVCRHCGDSTRELVSARFVPPSTQHHPSSKEASRPADTSEPERPPWDELRGFTSRLRTVDKGQLLRGYKNIERLRFLANDHDDPEPPNSAALALAKQCLLALLSEGMPEPTITRSVEEGICLSYRRFGRYADIECLNSGDTVAVAIDEHGRHHVWEVPPSIEGRRAAARQIRFHFPRD